MRSRRRPRNPVRDILLRRLNRQIDKTFHPLFNDPNKCAIAILADIYAHQLTELFLGLPPQEVNKRTLRYTPKAIKKCLEAILRMQIQKTKRRTLR